MPVQATAHSWTTTPWLPPSPWASSTKRVIGVAAAILTACAVLAIAGAWWLSRFIPHNPQTAAQPSTSASQRPDDKALLEPPLILTGVVEGGEAPYAVINDEIVGIGETIGGATLLGVTNGEVRLRSTNGYDIVLRVPR
jgi:hypothetical protein